MGRNSLKSLKKVIIFLRSPFSHRNGCLVFPIIKIRSSSFFLGPRFGVSMQMCVYVNACAHMYDSDERGLLDHIPTFYQKYPAFKKRTLFSITRTLHSIKIALNSNKTTLHCIKSTLHSIKRALHSTKRALYSIRKSPTFNQTSPHILSRDPYFEKKS